MVLALVEALGGAWVEGWVDGVLVIFAVIFISVMHCLYLDPHEMLLLAFLMHYTASSILLFFLNYFRHGA